MRIFAVLVFFLPALAYGQPSTSSTDANQMASDDCARARALEKPCELTIEAEIVDGTGVTGDGPPIDVRDFADFTSLVRIRRDFIAEILKSANDVD